MLKLVALIQAGTVIVEKIFWSWLRRLFQSVGNHVGAFFTTLANLLEGGGGGGGEGGSQTPNAAAIWSLLNTSSTAYGTPNAHNYGPGSIVTVLDPGWQISASVLTYSPDMPDCAGVKGGSAFLDDCGNCVGGTTGLYPCYVLHDCAGVANGTAYLDSCKKCVGGTTGVVSTCIKDCAGVWGGKAYIDICNTCVDSIRKQPCDSSYIKKGDSLYSFLNRPEFTDSLNKFKQGLATDTVEKAISFGTDFRGRYKATAIRISDSGLNVHLIYKDIAIRVLKMMHFHPSNAYNCFSNGDMYSLASLYNNPLYSQINSHYVIASDSSFYAMAIEDTALYSKFLKNYPLDSIRGTNYGYNINKPMGRIFNEIYNNLIVSIGDDKAFTQACAYVMSYFNSGLVLYRKEKNETRLTKINTKLISTNPTTGSSRYTTSNCL